METRCRIPIWRSFGRIQWHVIPEPRITLQGAATWRIQCHDLRAMCHIAGRIQRHVIIITRGQSNLTKVPHGGPIPRLGVTPGGRQLYR